MSANIEKKTANRISLPTEEEGCRQMKNVADSKPADRRRRLLIEEEDCR